MEALPSHDVTLILSKVQNVILYETDIRSHPEQSDFGKFIVIDIETGEYEIDSDEIAASDRLLSRIPNAQVWLRRVGSRYARSFGPRIRPDDV